MRIYIKKLDLQGLVALYDIRPERGEGLFLQPRSPHGAEASLPLRP